MNGGCINNYRLSGFRILVTLSLVGYSYDSTTAERGKTWQQEE
jgi:hypothetical protein